MSADPFASLISDSRAFLNDLADNNSKEWFAGNKAVYETNLKSPALALLDTVAASLEKQTGQVPSTKLFRPHRDVRFSKDKTPYHLHLHMLWSTPPTGFFFGIGRDYLSVGGGIMGLDKDKLTRWRAAVDGRSGAKIAAALVDLQASGARMDEAELKRVPAPFDKDHPQAALLKRKSCTVWFDFDESDITKGGLVSQIETAFQKLQPLTQLLRTL
ncbi:TIGR02453 family protein [Shimia sagamensis]|uniref:TIGR02453 family protein n=1 Tax=Shimia sagamensis TaxID=1566352 RepID=A0ABY1NLI8_9RHOB|nr:TIGR02453 family protein [Shimia sagamensis]SMP12942.1 TIGR02453 family protein [Shimia sagamensis]